MNHCSPTSGIPLWVQNLVQALGDDAAQIASRIVAGLPRHPTSWQSGTPGDWATDSFLIGRREVYARLGHYPPGQTVRLPRDYDRAESPVVRTQLAKAGLRLAWLLNTVFR